MIVVPVEKKIDWRRPPIILITLVLINIWVFAFYQAGDNDRLQEAVEYYYQNDMLETEWRAYKVFTAGKEFPYELEKDHQYIIYYIVNDPAFDRFMADSGAQYIPKGERDRWRRHREQLEGMSSLISTNSYAFYVDEISFFQLFSSQFLHGDIMHLFGNLIFLILVGFAVEAALGSGLFLLFYLLSGAAGALFYAAFAGGSGSLVGASGSISGVMAMYVVLFGMRKIQFFYWIFVFTGYVRAAAIIMLPIYILKEIYSYLTLEGSNVAFTAHIGGFLAGALLVGLVQHYRSGAIDKDYLENKPQPVDQTAVALQRVYDLLGNCQFSKAWEMLKPIKKQNSERADVIELEYNLLRAYFPKNSNQYLIHRMDKNGNSDNVIAAQMKLWRSFTDDQQLALSIRKRSKLFESALSNECLDVAEQVFAGLNTSSADASKLALMANSISMYCRNSNHQNKAKKYASLAQKLAHPSLNDGY